MVIRNEKKSDIEAISEVTVAAFENHPHGDHTEQCIVHALRAAHALAVSLVAEDEGRVVGHIAFSPVSISGHSCDWYGLGPISVLPECRRQGIGKSLIREGLSLLRGSGAKGCVLVGDPQYYGRFGFRNLPDLILEGVPREHFLALPFEGNRAEGVVVFHQAFGAKDPDRKLAAVCGLYCEACSWYIATQEDPEKLKRLAAQFHYSEEESKCCGCRSGKRLPYSETCKMFACAAERGIDFCSWCEEYPCDDLKQFQSAMPHRIELWVNLERVKSIGYKQWLKEIRENYTARDAGQSIPPIT